MVVYALAACLFASLEARDGTIVVLENSKPMVTAYTRSSVSHVAIILNVGSIPVVYEATPSAVRRLAWTEYCLEVSALNRGRNDSERVRMRLFQPARPYSTDERQQLRYFLESQLGRRYSVRGYVRDRPGDGIHCAEFVSTALTRTGRYQFPPNYSVSPAALVLQIKPSHHVTPVAVRPPAPSSSEPWCHRSWKWWADAFHWCGWACWEASTMWP